MNKNKKLFRILVGVVCVLLILLVVMQRSGGARMLKSKALQKLTFSKEHNLRNSLDWAGVYTGILPCADCDGIKVELILNNDETYEISYLYLGKSEEAFVFSGTFSWNETGNKIFLPRDGFPTFFQVGKGVLFQLDRFGNRITGELEDMYILTKIPQ